MIFGFGKKNDDVDDDFEEDFEYVLFQGPTNGVKVNLSAHGRLADAGLVPTKELVSDALLQRAEVLRLEPKGSAASIKFIVDGIPYSGGKMSQKKAAAVIQMLKLLAGLDITQRKKPQSGGIKAEMESTPYTLQVESTPIGDGQERLLVRITNMKEQLDTPEAIGLSAEMREKIREMMSHRKGAFFVCGPPHSGTTTSTQGVLLSLDAYIYSLYSAADPEGRELFNVTLVDQADDDNLEKLVDRVRRLEADLVYLPPVQSAESAAVVFKKCDQMTILAEFKARDAISGILQLIKWTKDPNVVAKNLGAIFSQKLIRKLCPQCREAFRPNPKLLSKVGLPPETKILYREARNIPDPETGEEPEPCRHCGGLGYRGRIPLFEFVEMTDAMRKVVAETPDASKIKSQSRKEKMPSFQKEGLRLVAEGQTSLEELQRAFR